MPDEKSVTMWVAAVRSGDGIAAQHLWQRYFHQLMHQARMRMSNVEKTSYDEEDAAISTFNVLCQKLQEGCYPRIADRGELWHLMLTVLVRKIGRRNKYQSAAKRLESRSIARFSVDELPAAGSQEIPCECFELIALLGDVNLQQVALLKFEGYTNNEIAVKMNRTRRTIQRMLNLIRNLWNEELNRESPQ